MRAFSDFFSNWGAGLNPEAAALNQRKQQFDQEQALRELGKREELTKSFGAENADKIMQSYKAGTTPSADLFKQGNVTSGAITTTVPETQDDLRSIIENAGGPVLPKDYKPFTNQPITDPANMYGGIKKTLAPPVEGPAGTVPDMQKTQAAMAGYELNPPLEKLGYGGRLFKGTQEIAAGADKPYHYTGLNSLLANDEDLTYEEKADLLARSRAGSRTAGLTSTKVLQDPVTKQWNTYRLNPQTNKYTDNLGPAPPNLTPAGTMPGTDTPALLNPRSGDVTPATTPNALPPAALPKQLAHVDPKRENLPSGEAVKNAANDTLSGILDEIHQTYKDEYVGPIAGPYGSFKDWSGLGGSEDRAYFKKLINKLNNKELYTRSGAAINEHEFARLMKELPDPNSSPVSFKAGMKAFERELQLIMETRASAFEGAGYRQPGNNAGQQPQQKRKPKILSIKPIP